MSFIRIINDVPVYQNATGTQTSLLSLSGATPVANHAALRLVPTPSDGQQFSVASPPEMWTYSATSGANFPDDDTFSIKLSATPLGSNGRFYIQASAPAVSTLAALRTAVSGQQPQCIVSAYSSKGDGGEGVFNWDPACTLADNGATIIQPTGATTGRWRRHGETNQWNVKWFGAKGAGIGQGYGCTTTSGSSTVVIAGLSSSFIGQTVAVKNAGPGGDTLIGVITAVSGSNITLSGTYATASITGSANNAAIGWDDTAAFTAAIAALNARGTGALYIPPGNYMITSGLTFSGGLNNGYRVYGDIAAGDNWSMTTLHYWGRSGAVVFDCPSLFYTRFERFDINCNGLAKMGFWVRYNGTTGYGVSGIVWEYVAILNMQNVSGAAAFAAGTMAYPTLQTDTLTWTRCKVTGDPSNPSPTYQAAGILVVGGGNTKSFNCYDCTFASCGIGIDWNYQPSGQFLIEGCNFGRNYTADLRNNGGTMTAIANNHEAACRLLIGISTVGSTTIMNSEWTGNPNDGAKPTPAYDENMIDYRGGALTLIGNSFTNFRGDGLTYRCKVRIDTPTVGNTVRSTLISQNNFYRNSSQLPFFDQADNDLMSQNYVPFQPMSGVMSIGDSGSIAGTVTNKRFKDIFGSVLELPGLSNQRQDFTRGTLTYGGRICDTVDTYVLTAADWNAIGTIQEIQYGFPARTLLKRIIVETTVAYAGLAGTIQLCVYIATVSPADLILAHDVKTAPVVKGLADADLGTLINRANAVQGGYMPANGMTTAWYPLIRLTSGTGNIGNGTTSNLTAGTTKIHFVTERLP